MKAAVVTKYGPPKVVVVRDVPDPKPGRKQVRVKVAAAAVTSGDARIRAARFPSGFGLVARPAMGFTRPRRAILGGTFSGADTEHVERLARLGDAVGTAFQISDDIIDISSSAEQSGKTPGTDLREGVHTLPVLYALREPGADGDRLRTLLARPLETDVEVEEALELLRRSPGMAQAKEKLQEYADLADAELAALPPGPANEALTRLVRYTIERVG